MTMQSKVDVNSSSEIWLTRGAKSNTDKEKEMLAYFFKTCETASLILAHSTAAEEPGILWTHRLPSGFKWPVKSLPSPPLPTSPCQHSYHHCPWSSWRDSLLLHLPF